jgi:hypothetical protein
VRVRVRACSLHVCMHVCVCVFIDVDLSPQSQTSLSIRPGKMSKVNYGWLQRSLGRHRIMSARGNRAYNTLHKCTPGELCPVPALTCVKIGANESECL